MNVHQLIRSIIEEDVIEAPKTHNTMTFWHGGNLSDYDDTIAHKKGRYEFGAGLYLTTSFEVVQKYRKGSRKLYMITVRKGTDIRDAYFDYDECLSFINKFVITSKRKEIILAISSRNNNGRVPASNFNNIVLNYDGIKSSSTPILRQFLTDNGIDYQMVGNAFGWGEEMMVLYNMKMIENVVQVKPGDKITSYDLSTEWN